MDVRAAFRSAGAGSAAYRAAPFWAWNDELDPAELRRQIREMRRAGLGGHFMHARVGLITPYMSEQWASCIKAAVDESKAVGLNAWLYDEDCWPSGSAGGAVPASSLEFQQKTLQVETLSPRRFTPKSNTIATFLGVQRRGGFSELRRVEPSEAAKVASARDTLLHFSYVASTGYTDLLSSAAVAKFIQLTHEKYRAWVGRAFGDTVPGIFTDEPQYRLFPWSFDLPEHFRKSWGKDLLDVLPSLFLRYGDYRQARWQYFSAVSALFVRSYSRQLGEWCRRHRLSLTGHVMGEDTLLSQLRHVGAAMPHYEHMQIPGVDQLLRAIGDPVTFKQASSAAHQLGRARVLSEMFGGSGWNVSFEELKALAEWQFALGVNLPCPHLSLYSLRGCRKRDYPPALHCQQPWWDDYRLLNDLFARELVALTSGRPVADILLLHPIESAYAVYDRDREREVVDLHNDLAYLSRLLMELQRDYDYGDETLMARRARVSGKTLRIGSAAYAAVILPPLVTIRSSTLRTLARFMKNGGKVIRTGRLPLRVDGEPSKAALKTLAAAIKTRVTPDALRKTLNACLPPRLELRADRNTSARSIYACQRDCDNLQLFFLANTSRRDTVRATLRVRGHGVLEVWDAESGQIAALSARGSGDCMAAPIEVPPTGSLIVALDKRRSRPAASARARTVLKQLELGGPWSLQRLDPNALTLDCCWWRAEGGPWNGPVPILDLQEHLAKLDRTINLEMRFTVGSELSLRPGRQLWLALEAPGEHSIAVNGHNIRVTDAGPWIDRAFRRVRLDAWKLAGENEILLRRRFSGNPELVQRMQDPAIHPAEKERMRHQIELESLYVAGDFAVRSRSAFAPAANGSVRTAGPFVLAEESLASDGATLVEDGLPFYAGRVELRQKVDLPMELLRRASEVRLAIDPPSAIVTALSVNGLAAGKRAWRPYHFDVGRLLKEGENEIAMVLTNSLRNLLGPHHHVDGEPHGVGPGSFGRAKSWVDAPTAPANIWRDDYSFVRLGLVGKPRLVFYA